ncbi:MAG TPA: SIMPL domain-containing protein [Candidatus Solibacter sp.]
MRIFSLILLGCAAACAQSIDGLSVSVTRNVTLAADEAAFTVLASAAIDVTAEQALQVLQTAGLQNLSVAGTGLGQTYSYPEPSAVQVINQINFTVPAAALRDAAKKLEALRLAPPQPLAGLQYSAIVNTGAATVEASRQTILPQLLAEAQKKAQFLATSAGVKLGAIKGVSESSYGVYALVGNWISSPQAITSSVSNSNSNGTQYTYYATVTFSLAP